MYQVMENGKPCDSTGFAWAKSWQCSKFNTFEDALNYAKHWLGQFDTIPSDWDGSPYDYSGDGDFIKISMVDIC